MKRFKYKQTDYIAIEIDSKDGYEIIGQQDSFIPKWVIENSNDWEEVEPILTTSDGVYIFNLDEELYYIHSFGKVFKEKYRNILGARNIEKTTMDNIFFNRENALGYISKIRKKISLSDIEQAYTWDKTAPLYTQFIDNLKKIVGE